jgi:hypothetical protein
MRPLGIALLSIGLFGCSATEHKINSRSHKQSPGTFTPPAGWVAIKIKGPARTENSLKPKENQGDDAPSITIDVHGRFDDRFPRSQKGCADSYLSGIHDVYDDSTRSELADIIVNPHHGKIQIYRFHSDWFGDHLVAFILTKSGFATLELWTKTAHDRVKYTEAFHQFIEGVRLK